MSTKSIVLTRILLFYMLIMAYQYVTASTYETTGDTFIPALRFKTSGYLYFDEGNQPVIHTLGAAHKGKVTVLRIVAEDIDVSFIDPKTIKNSNKQFYYRLTDHRGADITDDAIHLYPDNKALAGILRQNGHILSTGLQIDSYLLLSFYDQSTDTLLRSYCLLREQMYLQVTDAALDGKDIEILPGKQKVLQFARAKGSKEALHLSYRIESRWGRLIKEGKSRDSITIEGLPAGRNYILTVWSPLLPENEFSEQFHIHIRPYWYQTNLFYLFLGTSFLLITYMVFMRRKVKLAENRRIETEQKLLSMQTQLNPHFVFNALNSIKGLNQSGQVEEANQYLGTFSTLLRNALKNSEKISHPLHQELETLKIYLELEKLRFGFDWAIEIDNDVNPHILEIPVLLLQPLVENAIKHGVSAMETGGLVLLRIFGNGDDLVIEIVDNGSGFIDNPDNQDSVSHQGFGLRLTRDRIRVFNRLSQENQIMLIFEKHEGTVARLTFSNWFT